MFYLRELLNGYPSMEIYVRRPRLYPFRHPFLLKRVKKEASCPISLKEGRGWAQVGRYPAVFCKLGRKDGLGTYTLHHHCKRTWTWWIPDRCCAGLFALFLHDLWRSNIMNVKNEWYTPYMIKLSKEILTEEEDSREIFAVNIELCIFWLFFVLRNKINTLVKVVIWGRNCCYIWGNKTISRSLTLSLVVFLP